MIGYDRALPTNINPPMRYLAKQDPSESRQLLLGGDCCLLPERLLLAHGRGDVIFVTGAGTSIPSGLPDFRDLTLQIYSRLDRPLYNVLMSIPREKNNLEGIETSGLEYYQLAEAKRFAQADYDVALGMLERRIDSSTTNKTSVRYEISDQIRRMSRKPSDLHKSLLSLADRGAATTIVTTNFDLLLEQAAQQARKPIQTYSLSSIPRPGKSSDFSGVLHIHGAIEKNPRRSSQCIVTDRDFGEFYLRRQVVPEFIYDTARLFHIVLIGYSANDPPMRYLLNAIAADNNRFTDLKPRYAFVPYREVIDQVVLSDWRSRGIEPIPYDDRDQHKQIANTLQNWSRFSAINGDQSFIEKKLKKIVTQPRKAAVEYERDLFDHLYRRSSDAERRNIALLVSRSGASSDWLDSMLTIDRESRAD
ncbi:SIR2 family protein [Xanthomonas campestris]|uniref:SIR2 family protein n=1 Tax=Xanthomonas campestris TaxID=339 RepID=UPI001E59FAE2|nr:SIR2 family protein [Xanthomonas campestris]MCC5069601.1 SIR2 family protein [Xanthomonas campestris]